MFRFTFVLGVLLASAAGFWALHRIRVRHVLHQRMEQSRIELLEAKNAEMEHFTRTVSHDLKTPLYTINGFLGFLQQDLEQDDLERIPSHIQRIQTAVAQMGRLLDTLLELSHSGRVIDEPQEIDMGELARTATDLVAGGIAEQGVEVHIAPNLPAVKGDPHRLLQVFQNLLSNGIKFMGSQQQPRIELGARYADSNPSGPGGPEPVFYVRDNGVGIKPADQEKVFGLFDKLDSEVEGSGIGLALVQRIIVAHGGRIWVESEGVGKGSTFWFTLERTPDQTLAF